LKQEQGASALPVVTASTWITDITALMEGQLTDTTLIIEVCCYCLYFTLFVLLSLFYSLYFTVFYFAVFILLFFILLFFILLCLFYRSNIVAQSARMCLAPRK
jgi:hypothetical protein